MNIIGSNANAVYRCELEYQAIRKFCKTVSSTSNETTLLPKLRHQKRTWDTEKRRKLSNQVAEWFKSIQDRPEMVLSDAFRELCPFLPHDLVRDAVVECV